jgi:hypothetical protein
VSLQVHGKVETVEEKELKSKLPEKPVQVPEEQSKKGKSKSANSHFEEVPESIFLVPFPKVIFFYPTTLAALVGALWLSFSGSYVADGPSVAAIYLTVGFLIVFALNLIVFSFDFPRATSLTVFFLIAAVILGLVLLFTMQPNVLPWISKKLHAFAPAANATFFWSVAGFFGVIYLFVLISLNFDYWEVRPNELLHHHGVLSDLKRFSAPNIRIDKEINDVFEYMLLGSGRLIVQPSSERKAIVLDNVLFISKKERAITKMLGALQVAVRKDN